MKSRPTLQRLLQIMLFFIGLAILLSLGFWQLRRAAEKRELLAGFNQAKFVNGANIAALAASKKVNFKKVSFSGNYLNSRQMFLDNKYYQHQLGYNVITPVATPGGKILLVNRGWLPRHAKRQDLPKLKPMTNPQKISGMLYQPQKNILLLGQLTEPSDGWPKVIERLDSKKISDILGKEVYPFILILDKKDTNSFKQAWTPVVLPPERHIGYAIQWFCMAAILLAIGLWSLVGYGKNKNISAHEKS